MVTVSRDSMDYNFALQVERNSIEYNSKGIVYSHFEYYSNSPYYSKMEESLETYLDFEATTVSSVQ